MLAVIAAVNSPVQLDMHDWSSYMDSVVYGLRYDSELITIESPTIGCFLDGLGMAPIARVIFLSDGIHLIGIVDGLNGCFR